LRDGLQKGWQVRYRDEVQACGPHAVVGSDYRRAQVKRLAYGDGVTVIQRGAEHQSGLRNCLHSAGMGDISSQQDVCCVGLCGNAPAKVLLKAPRADHDQARHREFLANLSDGFDLQRKIVFGFQQTNRDQNGIVLREEGLQRFWQFPGRCLLGQESVRVNQASVLGRHAQSMKELQNFRIDTDQAIKAA